MDNKATETVPDLESKESHLHPLLINHIVDTILSFLDSTTLKMARQVNHLWKDEGAKHLIHTNFLQGPPPSPSFNKPCPNQEGQPDENVEPERIVALTSLISASGPPHIVNLNVHIQDRNVSTSPSPQPTMHITSQEIFWLCSHGNRIKHLKYSGRDSKLLYKILALDKLKNLKILETNALNVSPAGFQHLNLEEGAGTVGSDNNFWKKLSKIEQVRLNFCQTTSSLIEFAAFENSRKTDQGISPLNVTEVKFGWQFESVKAGLETYTGFSLPWKIERLKIHLYPHLPVNLTRQFFEQISPTLKHLTVYLKADKSNNGNDAIAMATAGVENIENPALPVVTAPPVDNWLIPWSLLSEVKTVEIAADKNCQNPSARLKMVTTALRMSKLKKMAVGEHIDEFIGPINSNQDSPCAWRAQSLTLQELEISLKGLASPTVLFEANLFPNLTRLLINFHQNFFETEAFKYQDEDELKNFSFKAIYFHLEKLERFEVTYEDPNFECWGERWDEVVTGLRRPQNYQSGQEVTDQENDRSADLRYSIRNLKSLKRFMLHDWNGNTVNRVTDFVIYNGLIHLKNIQSLHIYGHDFSKGAVDTLKAALGPNASVLIFST